MPSRTQADLFQRAEHLRDEADHRMQRAPGTRQPRFYLVAAPLIPQTPFAEVLTVVGQQSVGVFAQSGARSADPLPTIEVRWRIGSDPARVAVSISTSDCITVSASSTGYGSKCSASG